MQRLFIYVVVGFKKNNILSIYLIIIEYVSYARMTGDVPNTKNDVMLNNNNKISINSLY